MIPTHFSSIPLFIRTHTYVIYFKVLVYEDNLHDNTDRGITIGASCGAWHRTSNDFYII
jgi:hypothetical protein